MSSSEAEVNNNGILLCYSRVSWIKVRITEPESKLPTARTQTNLERTAGWSVSPFFTISRKNEHNKYILFDKNVVEIGSQDIGVTYSTVGSCGRRNGDETKRPEHERSQGS